MSQLGIEKVNKYLSKDGTIRVSAITATNLVGQMQDIIKPSPLATVALGRAMVGCVLLACHHKNGKTGLHFRGNGPLGSLYAEASFEGEVRAYVQNSQVDLALNEKGQFDVSAGIGIGLLNVTRTLPLGQKPYQGTVIIKTGEIAEDIAYYLQQSHQVPSVVAIGTNVNEYGLVTAAGGILIELMPGHTEKQIEILESNVQNAKSISHLLNDGASTQELVNEYLKGVELSQLEHEHELNYTCHCSKERVESSLLVLSVDEIQELIDDKKETELSCQFCGKTYSVTEETLQELKLMISKKSSN